MGAIQEHLGTHFLEVTGVAQRPMDAEGDREVHGRASEEDANGGAQDGDTNIGSSGSRAGGTAVEEGAQRELEEGAEEDPTSGWQ